MKVSGVVVTLAADVVSLLLYVPEIVPVTVGSFLPIATSITYLFSLSFSKAILTLKLLVIVLFTDSSIERPNEDLL